MMRDLKRREGLIAVPLMLAFMLLGAVIGIAAAILATWFVPSDAVASLLGSFLGAGGAVAGAVYVQRLERREQLTAPINRAISATEELTRQLHVIKFYLSGATSSFDSEEEKAGAIADASRAAQATLSKLPEAFELPQAVHSQVRRFKSDATFFLDIIEAYGQDDEGEMAPEKADSAIDAALAGLRELRMQLDTL